jgi:hypothetical protein
MQRYSLPCAELMHILLDAYRPCPSFGSTCSDMRWIPERGHIPRGFCGAVGELKDVKLVLIIAEPGDPHTDESYPINASPDEFCSSAHRHAYRSLESGRDQFHKNVRSILDRCWPGLPFVEQMRKTWITESVLCSARQECARVPMSIARHCADLYLARQLALLPGATVAALGGKSRERSQHLGRRIITSAAAAPPGCNFRRTQESWDGIALAVRSCSHDG